MRIRTIAATATATVMIGGLTAGLVVQTQSLGEAEERGDRLSSSLSDAEGQLEVCADVTRIGEHLWDGLYASLEGGLSTSEMNYFSAMTSLNVVNAEVEAVKSIIERSDYDSVPDMFDACSESGPTT